MASCGIFHHKLASQEMGQFWQAITTNQIINTLYFSGSIYDNHEKIQWLNLKKKAIQGTELAGGKKKTIHDNTCTFLI